MGLLGINYKYGGTSPETGFDCSGLVIYVFNQAQGLLLPRDSQSISRSGSEISRDELLPGDLVFFNTLRRPFSHVGIYLGEQRFIHSPSSGGQVEIVNMANRYWQQRYNGARRISM
jgi:cell wall-associated NlpC family hydrolase